MTERYLLIRHFLGLFLPLAGLVIAVAIVVGQLRINGELDRLVSGEIAQVHLGRTELATAIKTPLQHLMSLPHETMIQKAIDAASPDKLAAMTESLVTLLQRNPDFDQVRWIDQNGKERVRIDKGENGLRPLVKAEPQLQDKSGRDYFTGTAQMEIGQAYISQLDLNIENGVVEVPHKPTLRFATPVADHAGNRRGILVINFLAEPMLSDFIHAADRDDRRIMLLNRKGYWLSNPNPADEWGFVLGNSATLGSQSPDAWARIQQSAAGHFFSESGLWVWETVTTDEAKSGQNGEPYWVVISHQSAETVQAVYFDVWRPTAMIILPLLLVFAAMSWQSAQRSWSRQEAVKANVRAEAEAAANRRRIFELEQTQKMTATLTAIVQSSDDAIISKTLDGIITSWNFGAELMFGYSEQEMIGQPMETLIPPDRAQEEQQILAKIRNGQSVDHFETIRRRKNGALFPISVTISPIRDAGGAVIGASKIARDISDQKSAEAELRQHRDHLEEMVAMRTAQLAQINAFHRAILDSASYAIIACDNEGAVTLFNPAAEAMLGYRFADFEGRPTRFVFQDPDLMAARAAELSVELGINVEPGLEVFFAKPRMGLDDSCEWTLIRKDGTRVPVWRTITAAKGEDGIIVGYLGIYNDLTQRKRDDLEKQRLLDILELFPDFIGSADLDGRIKYMNRAAKQQMGLPANADISSRNISEMYPVWAGGMVRELGIPVALRDGIWRGETAILHKDGYEIPVSQVILLHRDESGAPAMLSTIMRDVREQKWREAELAAARDLAESASEAKGQFLTNMSHELRTPLNAILGFAQLLDSEQMQPTAAQKKDFVDHILKAGKHLLALINEILDLAKIESGTVSLSPEPVALVDILRECSALVEPLGNLRGVRLLFPEMSDLHVFADRIRFKQILLNLLSNAIKYNREAGSVVVSCAAASPGMIRISVQDTGLGLAPEQIERLFQPFERLGQESSGQEGTGIGLVVTKRLVELMEGKIGVTSTVGIGSVFWIDMKKAEPSATLLAADQSNGATAPIPPGVGKATLLYVEDNAANLKLVEEIIQFRGDLDMISAPDGNIGVQLAKVYLPRVILMDIHLPGMSGGEALQILKNDRDTAHIPVIALTASAMPRDVEKGSAAGFFRYIVKPIDVAELMKAIDSALAQAPSKADTTDKAV